MLRLIGLGLMMVLSFALNVHAEEESIVEVEVGKAIEVKVDDEKSDEVSQEEAPQEIAYREFELGGWYKGDSGFNLATESQTLTKQPFLLYSFNHECGEACDAFEKQVLDQKEFKEHVEDFSLVAINGDEDRKVKAIYGIDRYPSMMILKSKSSAQKIPLYETVEPQDDGSTKTTYDLGQLLQHLKSRGIKPATQKA